MKTNKQPASDYGEPWTKRESWFQSPYLDKSGDIVVDFEDMALSCINACAGMADPAAEIQAMRDAIREVSDTLKTTLGYAEQDSIAIHSSVEKLEKCL